MTSFRLRYNDEKIETQDYSLEKVLLKKYLSKKEVRFNAVFYRSS